MEAERYTLLDEGVRRNLGPVRPLRWRSGVLRDVKRKCQSTCLVRSRATKRIANAQMTNAQNCSENRREVSAFVSALHRTYSKTTLLYAVNSLSVVKRAQHKGNPSQERVVNRGLKKITPPPFLCTTVLPMSSMHCRGT